MLAIKKSNDNRLASLFDTVSSIDENTKIVLPKDMTITELQEHVNTMIKDAQPRYLRKDGRTSHDINCYKIPVNYFVVESNTVNYNSSVGSIFLDSDEEEDDDETEEIIIYKSDDNKKRIVKPSKSQKKENDSTNFTSKVPVYFREHDYGTMIALHIFKNGRKTIDELVSEIKGIEKHLITILVNKMIADGFLRMYKDQEEDNETGEIKELETLELVSLEKKKENEEQGMLSENKGQTGET